MDILIIFMDKSTKINLPCVRSRFFRTPMAAERRLGLWVDRIGGQVEANTPASFRILGLYCAVAVESGSGRFIVDGRASYDVGEGDVMLVFPDEPSIYFPEGKKKQWRLKWIIWGGREAEKFHELGFIDPAVPVLRSAAGIVYRASESLELLMDAEDLASILERANIISGILLEFYRHMNSGGKRRESDLQLEKTIELIENLPSKNFNIDELARFSGLSTTHFRRLFKSYTGRSPKDFIISSKISTAKRMLSSGKSIKETAFALGYNDIFYFMRIFRKYAGISPGRFH